MQVSLEKRHRVDAPVEAAWAVLKDIEVVAGCMPGAKITEKTGDNQYKGNVSVKVGPVQSAFGGTIDRSGTSSATMLLTASVSADEDGGSLLVGNSEIKVMGKMASFGARMINGVADQLIAQFLENFSNRVLAAGEGAAAEEAAGKVAEQPQAVNALALLWGMITGFFRRLFGGK